MSKLEKRTAIQPTNYGTQDGSRTSPLLKTNFCCILPSNDTADKNHVRPFFDAYKIIAPFGAQLGDSSARPPVNTLRERVAISITAIR